MAGAESLALSAPPSEQRLHVGLQPRTVLTAEFAQRVAVDLDIRQRRWRGFRRKKSRRDRQAGRRSRLQADGRAKSGEDLAIGQLDGRAGEVESGRVGRQPVHSRQVVGAAAGCDKATENLRQRIAQSLDGVRREAVGDNLRVTVSDPDIAMNQLGLGSESGAGAGPDGAPLLDDEVSVGDALEHVEVLVDQQKSTVPALSAFRDSARSRPGSQAPAPPWPRRGSAASDLSSGPGRSPASAAHRPTGCVPTGRHAPRGAGRGDRPAPASRARVGPAGWRPSL